MSASSKPSNIWLEALPGEPADSSPRYRVKILDFGLARAVDDDASLTQPGAIAGTPAYMAPEQATGAAVDPRCDLFSLGCVLYQAATGAAPFQGPSTLAILRALELEQPKPPRQVNPEVPPALDGLILRLLAKDPAGRPPSARAVVQALRALEDGPTEVTLPVAAGRPPRRRRWLPVALLLALPLPAGAWFAGQIIVCIWDRDGKETTLTLPPGSGVRVEQDGQAVAEVPAPARAAPASPLDRLRREDIPAAERLAGQPEELVAVLGTRAWRSWSGVDWEPPWDTRTKLLFAPDGQQVIALDRYGARTGTPPLPNGDTAKSWDAATGKERHRFALRQAARLDFLPEIRAVALSAHDDATWTWKLWDLDTGKEKLTLEVILNGCLPDAFAASPDGKLIFGGHHQGGLRLWDATTGKQLPLPPPLPPGAPDEIARPLGGVVGASFAPDSKLLAVLFSTPGGPPAATLKLYDLTTRTEVGGTHEEGMLFYGRPVFTPDDKAVLIARMDTGDIYSRYSVRLWDLAEKRWGALNVPGERFALSPDGKRVAASAVQRITGEITSEGGVYDLATGERVAAFEGPPVTYALTYSADGSLLAGPTHHRFSRMPSPRRISSRKVGSKAAA